LLSVGPIVIISLESQYRPKYTCHNQRQYVSKLKRHHYRLRPLNETSHKENLSTIKAVQ